MFAERAIVRYTNAVRLISLVRAGIVVAAASAAAPSSHSLLHRVGPRDVAVSGLQNADSETIPFIFDDNRIYAAIGLVKADGTIRPAVAFVDLGDPVPFMSEALALELQLGPDHPLRVAIGRMRLAPYTETVVTTPGDMGRTGPNGRRTTTVETTLPANILKDYVVTVDYAARRLTLRRGAVTAFDGLPVACEVNPVTGLVSVRGWVGDHPYAMAIDFGSAYTWFRADTVRVWTQQHPSWRRGRGAVGEANMQSGPAEPTGTIVRIPELRLGNLRVEQVGLIGIAPPAPPFSPTPPRARSGVVTVIRFADAIRRPEHAGSDTTRGDEFDWYSGKTPGPVIGWIGGNVLKRYRLTIDYPHHRTWWAQQRGPDDHELDQVGVTLQDDSGGFIVSGIAERDGKPTTPGITVGDRLLRIDGVAIDSMTRGAIFDALHGTVGAVKQLTVRRRGTTLTVPAHVTAF